MSVTTFKHHITQLSSRVRAYFSPVFQDETEAKDRGDEFWRQIRETKQTWRNNKNFNFRAYHSFGNS